jgi:hypothetical protein
MKRQLLIATALLPLLTASAAFAGHGGEEAATEGAPAAESYTFSPALAHGVLLLVIWLTVAAIILGPVVWYMIGDLWQRKNEQPFLDDPGYASASHSHTSAAQH